MVHTSHILVKSLLQLKVARQESVALGQRLFLVKGNLVV
jgi:hypothetical protein